MAGGAAVHLVPLRVAQIMKQIFRQAGSKNGHSSWVSLGDAQAVAVRPSPVKPPWEQREGTPGKWHLVLQNQQQCSALGTGALWRRLLQ